MSQLARPPRTPPGYFIIESIQGPLPDATGDGLLARIETACKVNCDQRPYAVANEYIAARLGFAAGLPVPPGEIVSLGDGRVGYVCLMFKPEGKGLPPVIPPQLVQQDAHLCTGIILFDLWIRNGVDRHEGNIRYHPEFGGAIFDHDLALLGDRWLKAAEDLTNACAQPSLDGHCLIREIGTVQHAHEWATRLAAVPQALIRESVYKVYRMNLINATERDTLIRFLVFRQSRLLTYLDKSRSLFKNVDQWLLVDGANEAGES